MDYIINKDKNRFNWCITGTLETSISSSDLWRIISSPSNLELFHPFCDKNPTVNWPGLNSVDIINYYSGLILERKFIKWVEGKGYDLFIGKKDGKQSFVSWRINKRFSGSKLSVSIYPYMFNKSNKAVNFLPFFLIIKPSLSNYINSVMKGLAYYIETKDKVKKNQFGSHKIFSN